MLSVLFLIRNEACCNKWLPEPINGLRRVIEFEYLAYINIVTLLSFTIYYSHIEMTIILVCNSKCLSIVALFYLTHFKIVSLESNREFVRVIIQIIGFKEIMFIIQCSNAYGIFGIISDDDSHYVFTSVDSLLHG